MQNKAYMGGASSKEVNIQQMLQNVMCRGVVFPADNPSMGSIDEKQDQPQDLLENPIDGNYVTKDGKYGKTKAGIHAMTLEQIYNMDEHYVQWVRSRISEKSSESSVDMQRPLLCIHQRDVQKSKRLQLMQSEDQQRPLRPSPSMVGNRGLGRPPTTQCAQVHESTRSHPFNQEEMEVDHWSMVSISSAAGSASAMEPSAEAVNAWAHFVRSMRVQQNVQQEEMRRHIQHMEPGHLAKFIMGMIYG